MTRIIGAEVDVEKRPDGAKALITCSPPDHEAKTPQSPVYFYFGSSVSVKDFVIEAKIRFEFDVYGSQSDKDANDPTKIAQPENLKYLGTVQEYGEENIIFSDRWPGIWRKYQKFCWVKLDPTPGSSKPLVRKISY